MVCKITESKLFDLRLSLGLESKTNLVENVRLLRSLLRWKSAASKFYWPIFWMHYAQTRLSSWILCWMPVQFATSSKNTIIG